VSFSSIAHKEVIPTSSSQALWIQNTILEITAEQLQLLGSTRISTLT
jgi:hypothetical protein